ncbi:ClpP/crotonase [Sparassis latifolia]
MSLLRLTATALRASPTTAVRFAAPRLQVIRLMSTETQYEHILISRPASGVGQITLNRPKALNALSSALFLELNAALEKFDGDDDVRALVLTGSERAFAAGADIKEMKDKDYANVYKNKFLENWSDMTSIRKPVIAAVSGYALGGGCELALMCDIILASPTAVFGQPEINLGVIPGGGGTQRLARAIGKSRTMELTLTGRNFSAEEAAAWGVVSRIEEDVVGAAVKLAEQIASKSAIAVQAGKESVNAAYEGTLHEGLKTERRLFHALFASKDQKEGMGAFAEKRKPTWSHS